MQCSIKYKFIRVRMWHKTSFLVVMNYSRSNLPLCRCNANYHKTSGQYELSKNLNHFHFILLALKDEYAYFSFIAIIIFCSLKILSATNTTETPFFHIIDIFVAFNSLQWIWMKSTQHFKSPVHNKICTEFLYWPILFQNA